MQQAAKHFADQLNKSLDALGLPINMRERSVILSKMLHIPRQQAWGLLEGHLYPDDELLQKMVTELEINLNK